MKLTKDFDLIEFSCPCGCDFDGVPMDVGFMIKLQKVRDLYGKPMKINSGYRCPEHNAKINGSPTSQHLHGLAADIHCTTAEDKYHLINTGMAVGMSGIGIYETFVHIDFRKGLPSAWKG